MVAGVSLVSSIERRRWTCTGQTWVEEGPGRSSSGSPVSNSTPIHRRASGGVQMVLTADIFDWPPGMWLHIGRGERGYQDGLRNGGPRRPERGVVRKE